VSFTTLCTVPSATTNAATNVVITSATLNGTVNANSFSTTVTFEFGTTSSYGLTITATQSPVTGSSNIVVNAGVVTLPQNTLYHYRVKTVNCGGTTYGSDKTFTTAPTTLSDNDGNNYNAIEIGTQVWMKENLKTTKFNDNFLVPLVTDNTTWAGLKSPGYCWYNNDETGYKSVYGALYNWYTVDDASNGHKNVCPLGWHVPNDAEWTTLTNYLGGASIAGGKMKESGTAHWGTPNTDADNSSGFTALPGGYRKRDGTSYLDNGYYGYWWSTSVYGVVLSWYRQLSYNNSNAEQTMTYNSEGISIRCVKD
jgi:uncharacterized protein (TIGR02145 family)